MKRVAVSGANGFVGRAIVHRLLSDQTYEPIGLVRSPSNRLPPTVKQTVTGDLSSSSYDVASLANIDTIIHAAARVHVMHDTVADPLLAFWKTNVQGTLSLARGAVTAGIRRFIFISSLKVNGESSELGRPIVAEDEAAPLDPYGVSKHEAEKALIELAGQSGLELVIIRPPLVYGPGARGNFAALAKLIRLGVPLPFGALTKNRRSFVGVDNLIDLIIRCIDCPKAVGQTFLVSDGHDLSTADLVIGMGEAIGRKPRLFAIPPLAIDVLARVLRKESAAQRLLGTLQVDISQTSRQLSWQPPVSVRTGFSTALAPEETRYA